jgi:hypothetical protein
MAAGHLRNAAFSKKKKEYLLWQDIQMQFVAYAVVKVKSSSLRENAVTPLSVPLKKDPTLPASMAK